MSQRASDPDDPDDVADLAALDAELPDAARAAARRRAARSDPRSAEVLDALAATRAELTALPEPEVPPATAARWEAALAAERDRSRPAGGAVEESPPTPRRRRLRPRVVLALSAAAAVVAAVVLGAPRPAPPVLTVSRVDLVAVATSAVGVVDVGDLVDPVRREACLRAVLPDAARERLLGGRRVVLDGRPGVLLVLATGTRGQLHVVTVDPGCGPAGGTLLAQVTVA
jgi:hypothetical protein